MRISYSVASIKPLGKVASLSGMQRPDNQSLLQAYMPRRPRLPKLPYRRKGLWLTALLQGWLRQMTAAHFMIKKVSQGRYRLSGNDTQVTVNALLRNGGRQSNFWLNL